MTGLFRVEETGGLRARLAPESRETFPIAIVTGLPRRLPLPPLPLNPPQPECFQNIPLHKPLDPDDTIMERYTTMCLCGFCPRSWRVICVTFQLWRSETILWCFIWTLNNYETQSSAFFFWICSSNSLFKI